MLIARERSLLLIVDVQERLAPAIADSEAAIKRMVVLLAAARELTVPVLASEHYPKGLGRTLPVLAQEFGPDDSMEKIHFSCWSEPACRERIEATGRDHIIVVGMETHVCVMQSALEMRAAGFVPFLAADAVASRRPRDKDVALQRLSKAGCQIVTSEMVLFEWLRKGGDDEFRRLLPLIY